LLGHGIPVPSPKAPKVAAKSRTAEPVSALLSLGVVAAEVPSEAVVRASPDRGQAESWTLVLEAMAIPHRVVPTEAGFAVMVPPQMVAPAIAALDAQDKEASEPPLSSDLAPPDHGRSFVGLAMSITLLAFFLVAGPRSGADAVGWFRCGSGIAEAIVHQHELWRAITALTLHADVVHLAGNVVATLVFVTALGRWLGGGLALVATLFCGAAGNLLTAYVYGSSHNVVGASTSTFAALGVLSGLQFVRRMRMPSVGRMRRALLGIAGALGLLAMLGIGSDMVAEATRVVDVIGPARQPISGRTDVVGHAAGLGFGILAGVLCGFGIKRPVRLLGQGVALAATVAALVGAWLLAFHHS
jgi:rhomboid protease GluP